MEWFSNKRINEAKNYGRRPSGGAFYFKGRKSCFRLFSLGFNEGDLFFDLGAVTGVKSGSFKDNEAELKERMKLLSESLEFMRRSLAIRRELSGENLNDKRKFMKLPAPFSASVFDLRLLAF